MRDPLEEVEHPLVARVVGVRPEIEAGAGLPAQRGGVAAHERLRFDDRDALPVLRELQAGGESADTAAHHDGVAQEGPILVFSGRALAG